MTIDDLNELIEEEGGLEVTIDDYFIDSDLDSFGIAVTWFKLDEMHEHIDKDYYNDINYVTYTVKELLDKCNEAN